MATAAALAALGVLPATAPAYDALWATGVPLGAALLLLDAPIERGNLVEAGATGLAAFALATAGAVAGTLLAWRVAAPALGGAAAGTPAAVCSALCASYIGGSLNFAAVVQALGVADTGVVATAVAVDNAAMAIFFSVLSLIPAKAHLPPTQPRPPQPPASERAAGDEERRRRAYARDPNVGPTPRDGAVPAEPLLTELSATADAAIAASAEAAEAGAALSAAALARTLAAGAACCALGDLIATTLGLPHARLAFMSLVATAVAACACAAHGAVPSGPAPRPFAAGRPLANVLLTLFFASIGASAGASATAAHAAPLAAFVGVLLATQLALTLAGAAVLRLPRAVALVAVNAAVGGPATAAAMASARGWPSLIQAGLVLGSLGYSIGTGAGLWIAPRLAGAG